MAFNKLSPAQAERLALLIEECGEVVHIACKVLRHGYESCHPQSRVTNREELAKEMGDLRAAMILMCRAGDVEKEDVHHHADDKLEAVQEYLHHQPGRLFPSAGEHHAG